MKDPTEVLVGHIHRLARSVTMLGALAVILGFASLGYGVWILFLMGDLSRASKEVNHLRAAVDSLRATRSGAVTRLARDSKRLAIVESRVNRMWGGVRRAEVAALRNWISRLETQTEENRGRLEALNRRLDQRRDAARESLGATPSRIEPMSPAHENPAPG